ncbi:hypothetical protein H5407_06070 [Mitsuaria sp. WAJ17]|uniref:transporter substrate-binding domain-containing protein n=1 Tax=Mitsuaria sp. WAJ17 TaxID=2761452 RepID=UPI001603E6DA|nr:transporter substrate-binding domain-containing protein [Mitsuaria sp. WAJ17]MBB2484791.1 hypothetical protein [Mitsuaria sp. WAJ17]
MGGRLCRIAGLPAVRFAAVCLLALGPGLAPATGTEPASQPTVELLYQDRPPYYMPQPGRQPPQGLVIEPLRRALERTGLPHRWALTPAARQLLMVENGEHLVCGVGWFRNPAREARGQFSAPLYRGQHVAMIARRDAPLHEGMSLREALDSPARMLVKQGYSYGAELDALIAERPGRVTQGSGEVGQLLRMLQAGHADWMPAAPEEVQAQLLRDASREKTLQLLHFSDPPVIVPRHLYCNKAVPAAWLERLGTALR